MTIESKKVGLKLHCKLEQICKLVSDKVCIIGLVEPVFFERFLSHNPVSLSFASLLTREPGKQRKPRIEVGKCTLAETKKKTHDQKILSLGCCCTLVTLDKDVVKAEQIICKCILKIAK